MGKRKSYFHKKGESQAEKKLKLKFGESFNKIDTNMKGFLVTYNCKFTFCLNESKKLLQQFSLPSEVSQDKPTETSGDLDKELQQELDSLNQRDKEFAVLDTGAKYTIFINLESVDPNQVVEAIFEHMETTKKPLGRYIQRLLPIANTCKAHLEDIHKCIVTTLDRFEHVRNCSQDLGSDAKPFKYCCVYKNSNNKSIQREDVFRMVGGYFQDKNPANKVDFDEPEYVLVLQVICKLCFVSFVRNYFKFKKYNFIEQGSKFSAASLKNNVPPGQVEVEPIIEEAGQVEVEPIIEEADQVEVQPIIEEAGQVEVEAIIEEAGQVLEADTAGAE